jgi:DNA-binding NarL/FixJ family response regulator
MTTAKELERIQKAIATPKMNKLISDRPDLHTNIKIELYKSGMTYRAIADLFTANGAKTTHQTVAKVITKAGINRTQAPQNHAPVKPKTLEKEQDILTLRKQGLTQVAIASQLGISTTSVSRVLKLNGLNTKQGYSDRFDIAAKKPQIIRLHNKGLSYKAIAEKLGISDKTVTKVMRSRRKTDLPEK